MLLELVHVEHVNLVAKIAIILDQVLCVSLSGLWVKPMLYTKKHHSCWLTQIKGELKHPLEWRMNSDKLEIKEEQI